MKFKYLKSEGKTNAKVRDIGLFGRLSVYALLFVWGGPILAQTATTIPDGVYASAASSSQVSLTWSAVSNATGYNIKRSLMINGPYLLIASNLTATTYSDKGLANWTTYYYEVSAVNGVESGNSFPVIATTTPTPNRRVIITDDYGADPDDEETLVHALVCANDLDIEGIIATTSCWKTKQNSTAIITNILNAYEKVVTNLSVHASGYPSLAYLQSLATVGQTNFGMAGVGANLESPGAKLIIAAVDKDDPRPVWVTCQGGANTLAQALWTVQHTRTPAQVAQFVGKLRVYDILGQDDAGAWMTHTFTNLFYIRALGVYSWQPSKNWIAANVQTKGPLGAVYPSPAYAIEGDSPAFFYLLANGLSDPEHVDWGSWGGRFNLSKTADVRGMTGGATYNEAQYDPYYMFSDAPEGGSAIGRWSTAIDNDFAARMDWSITSSYSRANHTPIAVLNGNTNKNVLQISAAPGSSVALSAVGSSDPDGNALTYSWSIYKEPSSYTGTITIQNSNSPTATFVVPSDATNKTIHVVLGVHDNGTPNLYAYRRAIITVGPPSIPTGLYATVVSSNKLDLTWNASSNAISYSVKRSAAASGPYMVIATNLTTTTFSDTRLTPSTTYYYVVSASNGLESGDSASVNATTGSAFRPRVVIISDFPPTNVCLPNNGCPSSQTSDPDDVQSMVRFLLYANDFDVEGMVASSGTFANIANKTNILDMLDLYSQVYTNLIKHDLRYPTPDALRAVTFQGRDGTWGKPANAILGAGMDSKASDAIIKIVNQPDPRPVYFCVWTGTREIAQAIWDEQQTNTPTGLQAFLSKMRIYAIGQQDGSVGWLLTNFPNLFIIDPQNTWTGMFGGANDPLGNLAWLNTHIRQNHGPLGAIYPPAAIGVNGLKEGDTPSFLYLVSAVHGLNNPEDPTQPSWGGQFVRLGSSNHFVDGPGPSSISMWKTNYQAEFAKRANWMLHLGASTSTTTAPLIGLSTSGLTGRGVSPKAPIKTGGT